MRATDHLLLDLDGRPWQLSQAWALHPAFLVFYPGDGTQVCTAQLCSYRDHWSELSARATLVGINPAAAGRHRRFHERHGFPFPLLSDADGSCCRAYGAAAWWGTRRLTVLVDTSGIIRWRRTTFPLLRPSTETLLAALAGLAVPAGQP